MTRIPRFWGSLGKADLPAHSQIFSHPVNRTASTSCSCELLYRSTVQLPPTVHLNDLGAVTMASLSLLRQQASSLAGPAFKRCFSSSRSVQATYGFIGLGRMGKCHCDKDMKSRMTTDLRARFRLPNGEKPSSQDREFRHARRSRRKSRDCTAFHKRGAGHRGGRECARGRSQIGMPEPFLHVEICTHPLRSMMSYLFYL